MGWPDFCIGTVAGATLSFSRPPAGISIEEWMSPSGSRLGLWRAGALTVIAAALLFRSKRRDDTRLPAVELALGATFGFALHGFVLVDVLPIGTQLAWFVALAIALCVMLLLRLKPTREEQDQSSDSSPRLLRLCMALSGAGFFIASAAVNSRACLLGAGTRDDDTIFGAVALALFALGALTFGPLLSSRKLKRSIFPLGLALAALLAWFSFDFLGALANPNAYDALMQRFGVNSGLRGSFGYDALIAARVFGLPALCAGIAFASLRSMSDFCNALLGAATAAILAANWGHFEVEGFGPVSILASQRADWGIALAGIGAVGAACLMSLPRRTFFVHALVPFVCLSFGLSTATVAALPMSPWEKIAPRVEWIRDTPEGLLAIEFQTGRGRIVTLDRRRLTPTTDELEGDATRLRRSVAGLGLTPDAVLAGVLTPERALVLHSMGMKKVFVETPWPELEVELEAKLFELEGQVPGLDRRPAHDRGWETDDVSAGVTAILAPPVQATAYTVSGLDSLDFLQAPRIGWLSAQQGIEQLAWSERVLVSCAHLEDFAIGVVRGTKRIESMLPSGSPRISGAWSRLAAIDITQREFNARSRVAERLMLAAKNPVMDALRQLCEAQRPSSPFETRAQRTELDASAIDLLRKSALAAEPQGFERELDEFVATTLADKRDLEALGNFAQPIADAYPAWVKLQRAAATADWEFMRWADAAKRLEKIASETPNDLQARLWLAEALLRAEQSSEALKVANELLVILPGRLEILKLRAIAALHAKDARGRGWMKELLRDHPGDADLSGYTVVGPLPPLWPSLGIPGQISPTEEH